MKFCMQKQIITPTQPVFLCGFGGRSRKHDGVIDDIYARVTLLQQNKPLLIIQFDLTGGDRSFTNGIKNAMKKKFNLQEDEIMINFSHSHYSIFVTGEDSDTRRGMYSIGQDQWPLSHEEVDYTEDIRYFHFLKNTIIGMTEHCFANLQEGRMLVGKGTSDFGCSRRLITEDGLKFRPNFNAPIDKDLYIYQLVDTDKRLKGLIYCYGCHPTSMRGNRMSAEFIGAACTYLEEIYPEANAVFLQGCAGDVKLRMYAGEKFGLTTPDEMRVAAEKLGEDVIHTIKHADFVPVDGPVTSKLIDVRLFTEFWEIDNHEKTLNDESLTEYRKLRTRIVIDSIRNGTDRKFLQHWIQIWQLGDTVKIIAMEGEIPSAYALKIKQLLKGQQVTVLGYTNGTSSYIPTRQWLEEGGYEVEAVVLHGLRGPLVKETEDIIIGAIARSELLNGNGRRTIL